MNISTPDGRVIGRVSLTGDDVTAVAHAIGADLETRTRALIADARRAAITTGGGWTPGPTSSDDDRPSSGSVEGPRRRRWWPWIVGVFAGLALLGMIADTDETPAADTPAVVAPTPAPQPLDAARAVPSADGSVMVGSVVVDNVYEPSSPLRKRFAGVIVSYGATGTHGSELDANLRDGVAFCRDLAAGRTMAQRHASIVTGVPADGYGDLGTQRRAVVVAALSTLCPAL
ncbi:membrane protein [Gordonia phage GTE8]|uniref:DUF732 domain-containing protein n=1 Tax=Gordonia phage GTE8 TaxID=1647475 RepID=A0A0K0N672_9CAUD|nr:membrane protein [Gordonia phage GTE8]AKJ72419.1 hypothetical protein GTE8_76 [Gordonia phage GTE8]